MTPGRRAAPQSLTLPGQGCLLGCLYKQRVPSSRRRGHRSVGAASLVFDHEGPSALPRTVRLPWGSLRQPGSLWGRGSTVLACMVIIIIIVVSPRRCAGRLIHRHGHHLRVASIEVVIMMGHLSCLVPFAYPGAPCDSRGACGAAGQRYSHAWSSSSSSLLALVVVRVVLFIAMVTTSVLRALRW